MNQLNLLQSISKYLARFSEQVKILNKAGDFSINKISEDILIELLNNAFELNLVNVNYSEKGNYPAIDLIDYQKRTAFQITATPDISKIKNSITKFYTHKLFKDVDTFYVYILTERQETYSTNSINSHIKKESKKNNKIEIIFDTNKNILDKREIFKKYSQSNSIDKILAIENYLEKHFGFLTLKENLSPYYQKLKNLFYEIVFDDESGMTLKDIYIEPSFAIYEKHITDRPKSNSSNDDLFVKSKGSNSLNTFLENFATNTISVKLRINNPRCLLLLGYPGQGKTSCLKKFLNQYLIDNPIPKKDIFYFKLKNIRQGKLLIESPINVLFEEACNDTGVQIDKVNFRKSILLLDGLDELFMKENMKLDDIEKICKEISREVERYADMHVIITSRYGYVELNRLQKESCLVLQISLLSLSDQIDWLIQYKKFHENTWLTSQKIIEFNDSKNHKYSYVRELISQPLLLQIICSLHQGIELNSTRAQIYSRLFTELIERKYSGDGQLENFANIGQTDLRFLIQEIAFLIHKSGDGYIVQQELLETPSITEYLSKFPNQDYINSIKGILISFYFREHKHNNSDETAIEFLHKSLQEYMTAEKIDRTIFDKFLDTNKKGAYIINSYDNALAELNSLFAPQHISWEVEEYIIQLIENRSIEERKELSDRLFIHFKSFVEHDFLLQYDATKSHPLEMSLQTFLGYWMYLSRSNQARNYLIDVDVRERVIDYFILVDNSNFIRANINFLNWQDFSNTRMANLSVFEGLINNCIFFDVEFYNMSIYETYIQGCNFENIESYHFDFWSTKILNTSFKNANFDFVEFNDVEFENVDFSEAYFDDVKFKNCKFKKIRKNYFNKMRLTVNAIKTFYRLNYKIDLTRSYHINDDGKILNLTAELLKNILEGKYK